MNPRLPRASPSFYIKRTKEPSQRDGSASGSAASAAAAAAELWSDIPYASDLNYTVYTHVMATVQEEDESENQDEARAQPSTSASSQICNSVPSQIIEDEPMDSSSSSGGGSSIGPPIADVSSSSSPRPSASNSYCRIASKPSSSSSSGRNVRNGGSGGGSNSSSGGVSSSTSQARRTSNRRNAWGNYSYADLITQALESTEDGRLTLSQIYDWMVRNIDYFSDKGDNNSSAGWKNSIRHNLSLHNRFMRVHNEGTGKSSWWMVNADATNEKPVRRRAISIENSKQPAGKRRGRTKKKLEVIDNVKKEIKQELMSPERATVASTVSPSTSAVAQNHLQSPTNVRAASFSGLLVSPSPHALETFPPEPAMPPAFQASQDFRNRTFSNTSTSSSTSCLSPLVQPAESTWNAESNDSRNRYQLSDALRQRMNLNPIPSGTSAAPPPYGQSPHTARLHGQGSSTQQMDSHHHQEHPPMRSRLSSSAATYYNMARRSPKSRTPKRKPRNMQQTSPSSMSTLQMDRPIQHLPLQQNSNGMPMNQELITTSNPVGGNLHQMDCNFLGYNEYQGANLVMFGQQPCVSNHHQRYVHGVGHSQVLYNVGQPNSHQHLFANDICHMVQPEQCRNPMAVELFGAGTIEGQDNGEDVFNDIIDFQNGSMDEIANNIPNVGVNESIVQNEPFVGLENNLHNELLAANNLQEPAIMEEGEIIEIKEEGEPIGEGVAPKKGPEDDLKGINIESMRVFFDCDPTSICRRDFRRYGAYTRDIYLPPIPEDENNNESEQPIVEQNSLPQVVADFEQGLPESIQFQEIQQIALPGSPIMLQQNSPNNNPQFQMNPYNLPQVHFNNMQNIFRDPNESNDPLKDFVLSNERHDDFNDAGPSWRR